MTKNALLEKGPKNSGMGRPPTPSFGQCPKENVFFSLKSSLTLRLNFYFASKLNQLVTSPLIDQEFPFLIRRGRRREHYTLLSPNFNPKLCRSSMGPFIFCDISSISSHLLVTFSSVCDICHQRNNCSANMIPIIFLHLL